jgi:hypothetical protein
MVATDKIFGDIATCARSGGDAASRHGSRRVACFLKIGFLGICAVSASGPGMLAAREPRPGWRRHGCRRPLRTRRTARSRRSATKRPHRASPVRSAVDGSRGQHRVLELLAVPAAEGALGQELFAEPFQAQRVSAKRQVSAYEPVLAQHRVGIIALDGPRQPQTPPLLEEAGPSAANDG